MDERERKEASRARTDRSNPRGRRPAGNAQRPGRRTRRKSSRARRQRRNMIIRFLLLMLVAIVAAGVFFIWRRYGSSSEKADLEQYYGLENGKMPALVIDNEVIRKDQMNQNGEIEFESVPALEYEGQYYIEYSVVKKKIDKRFYWDSNEGLLLYTLPEGSVSAKEGSKEYSDLNGTQSEEYVILKNELQAAYIALPFIQKYSDMKYEVYEDQGVTRVVITSKWGEVTTASMKRDSEVRYQGGVKSPVLTEAKKASQVVVLEDEDDWMKVATEDGFIGYVKTNDLKNISETTIQGEAEEPVYTNIVKDYKINMAWHTVFVPEANSYLQEYIDSAKGLNTIAPTWFTIADTQGNISSLADEEYVKTAHENNIEVWAVFRDFHGGINSYEETEEVLSYTSRRAELIGQVIQAAVQAGVDGINLDFELVSSSCGEHYVQFVRELSVACRKEGLVFSVDNYVPQPYNTHYDIEEQGCVADYVIIMCYDEHTEGSYEAGSVASLGYLEDGVTNALEKVPASKLVAGVPFYTRLWCITPKTSDELAADRGTEAESYRSKVTSEALGMEEAAAAVSAAGAELHWDSAAGQNFSQWEKNGSTYQIWLEDSQSMEEKLKVIQYSDLAGVAAWRIGMETSSIWDLILQYIH